MVDMTIPLPYPVPDINVDRVGFYFASSTIGDAYRQAVRGNASWFAWIQAGATITDDAFHAAGLDAYPGARDAFRAAYQALKAPGGTSFTGSFTVTPTGAATLDEPTQPVGPTMPEPGAPTNPTPNDQLIAAQTVAVAPIDNTGLPVLVVSPSAASPDVAASTVTAPSTVTPYDKKKALLYAGIGVAGFFLVIWLARRA